MNFISSLCCSVIALTTAVAQAGEFVSDAQKSSALDFSSSHPWDGWTVEFGIARMTDNCIDDFLRGEAHVDDGPAGAETYQFTATKTLRELPFQLLGHEFRPLFELPLCLEFVDQNSYDDFFVSNFAFQLRWVDFPWNHLLKTSFGAGLGLSYASQIYAMDRQRHPNEDRSNLKFNLPIFVSFSLPELPEHQVRFYIAHHSGGFGTFDQGGVNSLGVSYAYSF